MRAVITRTHGSCSVEEVELRALGRRDVLVRIAASGICHSDVSLCTGTLPGELPVVLGHEGAGTVVEVGPDVTLSGVGDRVVLAAVAPCGQCWFCARGEPYLCAEVRTGSAPSVIADGRPIRGSSGLGTLAEFVIVDERAAVAVVTDLPAQQLAVIGCAVLTGAGSVFNIAETVSGDAVLVVGAGGIGLSAVQAARAAGAVVIVAVDPSPAARSMALAVGATDAAAPTGPDLADELLRLTSGRGFDAAFECVGVPATFELAWSLLRRGGHLVAIGVGPEDAPTPIPIAQIVLTGRRISGCTYGSSSVRRDIPRFVALAESGRLDLAALIGRTIGLEDVPDVLPGGGANAGADVPAGRTVIIHPEES